MAKIIEVGEKKYRFVKAVWEYLKEFLTWRNIVILAVVVLVALAVIFGLYYNYNKEEPKELSEAEKETISQEQLLNNYQSLREQYVEQGLIQEKTEKEQADLLEQYNKQREEYIKKGLISP